MKLKTLFAFLLFICVQITIAQTTTIKGKVSDSKNQNSLNGVTVKVGDKATRTNENGNFEIEVPIKIATERGITFSYIGYLTTNLIYQPDHVYKVQLTENSTVLNEVIVGIKGEDIIKKAIKKIPENYPDKPTSIKGILRIQKWRNNSQYFRSDAVLQAHIPPYTSNEETKVKVLSNQLDTVYDESLKYIRNVGSYNLVEFGDIAHNKEILNKLLRKRKFDYRIVGKQLYNGHKVYVINSTLLDSNKKYNKLEATLYIDTASYAFVAANLTYYNIPRIGPFIARKEINRRVAYEKIGKKWYLAEAHSKIAAEYKDEEPQSISNFIRTSLDTSNVEKIAYKDVVQKMDDIFLVKQTNIEEFEKHKKVFQTAELQGKLAAIPLQKIDTIKQNSIIANQNYVKPFGRKVYDYIRGDNARSTIFIKKLPLTVNNSLFSTPESMSYGFGFGSDYRLFKSVFLGFQLEGNLPNKKKVRLSGLGLRLSNEFIFNKNARNIGLTPHVGINQVSANLQNDKVKYNFIDYGFRGSYDITRKKAVFLTSSFNSASGSKKINEFAFVPRSTALGVGIIFKN